MLALIMETGLALFLPTIELPVFLQAVSNTAYLSPAGWEGMGVVNCAPRNRKIESLSTGGQIFSTSYVAITSFSELEWAWICAYMAHFCLGWQRIIQTTRSHCFLPKFVKFNMYNYSIIILYFFQKTSIAQKILNFLNRPNIPILKNRFF